LIIRLLVVLTDDRNLEMYSMPEQNHQPVTIAGLLLLAAIALLFLTVIWLIGSAFARAGTELSYDQNSWNQRSLIAFL
jgi:hypothetical protein